MRSTGRSGFTLIELLVVIAVIAVLAGILFPVFAQVREQARMSACSSNTRQMGISLMMYTQDYDETFPCVEFNGFSGRFTKDFRGNRLMTWRNAIAPYLKSIDVFGCPSNPFHNTIPGKICVTPPVPGSNAEGWEVEPGQRMPVSYAMNACAASWIPANTKDAPPPLRQSQLLRPAETILISESLWGVAEFNPEFLWDSGRCSAVFAHPGSKQANFVFGDGHVKAKKWLATLYPVTENNWEPGLPNSDPQNRHLVGVGSDCDLQVPAGPDAKDFQACPGWQ